LFFGLTYPKKKAYAFAVHQVEIFSRNELIATVESDRTLNFDVCKERVKQSFKKSDEEIEELRLKVSLKDPVSMARIKIPARGKFCKHLQVCFCFSPSLLALFFVFFLTSLRVCSASICAHT
jgi:hypothetical protein